MGNAADAHDINIQYCLTLTRHGLTTLEIPRVTMARASADYAYNFVQWTIGITGMITDSIGLAPHKDTFYTVEEMPDNGLGWKERNSDLHCAVATLSTGPVAFGDKPGYEDRELLMKCCREDGKILKPSRAIAAVDSQIRNLAIDIEHAPGSAPAVNGTLLDRWHLAGQVWTTMSRISQHWEFGIIFGSSLSEDYFIGRQETGFHSRHVLAYKGYPSTLSIIGVDPWPIQIDSSDKFGLYYTSPIITLDKSASDDQIALIGDVEKWVPMSEQRVSNIINYGDFLHVELDGVVGEKIFFFYAYKKTQDPEFRLSFAEVEFGASLRASIRIENGRATVTYN